MAMDGGCRRQLPTGRTHSPSQVAWSKGRRPLGGVLHSPNEPSEPCGHDDSTINIVLGTDVIITIIIIIPAVRILTLLLGDWKDIQPVKNLATTMSKGFSLGDHHGI